MSKLYVWTNSYLSDLQKGIQTAHLVNLLHKRYNDPYLSEAKATFVDWAYLTDTVVVYAGGGQADLDDLKCLFEDNRNYDRYPFAAFLEDGNSLNGAMTAVGIILPEKFSKSEDRQDYMDRKIGDLFDWKLADLLEESKLA
jgi:hypothetical protein